MVVRLSLAAICASLWSLVPSVAMAADVLHEKLTSLAQDITYSSAALLPMNATYLGIPNYDAELNVPTEENRAAYIARLKGWQQQLAAISAGMPADAALVDRNDARLLGAQLTAELNSLLVYQTDRKDYGAAANRIVAAIFTQFQHLPVIGQEGASAADRAKAWSQGERACDPRSEVR